MRATAAPGYGARAGIAAYEPPAEESADHDGAWLFSFVDILTLLVTLMALLLAYTYVPQRAHPQHTSAPTAAEAVPASRADTSPAPPKPARRPGPVTNPAPGSDRSGGQAESPGPATMPSPLETKEPTATAAVSPPKPDAAVGPRPATRQDLAIPPQIRDRVKVTRTGQRINVVIKDDVLFKVGSARLTGTGTGLLSHVAEMLKQTGYPISVEGHTDDTPIHTARFPSNWELSTARATNVTRYLIERGVAAARLRAIGYGATRPVAGNDTPAGRAQNRRVALVLHVNGHTGPDTAGTNSPLRP